MMLLRNMQLSNCSHWLRNNPTVVVKKVGKNTKNPNCAAVLIMRTIQPINVFGFFQAIEKLEKSESRVLPFD